MRLVTLSVLALLLVSSAVEAQPSPPSICNTAQEAGFFAQGVRKGRSLAKQAIARATDPLTVCTDLEGIAELRATAQSIVDALYVPPGASEVVRCHLAGQVAGLLAQLQDLTDECVGLCIADGLFVGELSGRLYCALSIALGGLVPVELFERLPTDACGTAFQASCDAGFVTVATGDPDCVPFTVAPHTEAYLEVQNNQCAENPDEGP
jgi:hypothetical protein